MSDAPAFRYLVRGQASCGTRRGYRRDPDWYIADQAPDWMDVPRLIEDALACATCLKKAGSVPTR